MVLEISITGLNCATRREIAYRLTCHGVKVTELKDAIYGRVDEDNLHVHKILRVLDSSCRKYQVVMKKGD